jgi:hypothetical protein
MQGIGYRKSLPVSYGYEFETVIEMKTCPKGHRYPDSLDCCPVCEKEGELKTRFGEADQKTSTTMVHAPDVPSPKDDDEDSDKTVFMGASNKHMLIGWLIELDSKEMPVNSYQIFNQKTTIGRRKNNDIVIREQTLSGTHCIIEVRDKEFIIYDNNSTNGTMVDDKPVTSPQMLTEDHMISLGELKLRIKYL